LLEDIILKEMAIPPENINIIEVEDDNPIDNNKYPLGVKDSIFSIHILSVLCNSALQSGDQRRQALMGFSPQQFVAIIWAKIQIYFLSSQRTQSYFYVLLS
jgi:hypothetical protein